MKAIYCILNKLNERRYVGSSMNFNKRKSEHLLLLRGGKHHSVYLQNSWDKYGEHNFEFVILEEIIEDVNLIVREQWWIDNTDSSYNMCKIAGSTLGIKCSDETKSKIRDKLKGKRSEKQIKSQLDRRKPVNQYDMYGTFIKGWKSTQEAAYFLNANHKNIINAACGKSNCSAGFRWAYINCELKDIKRTNQKFIHQYDKELNFIKTWYTITEASIDLNISISCIIGCAKGDQKTSGGYIWKYNKLN